LFFNRENASKISDNLGHNILSKIPSPCFNVDVECAACLCNYFPSNFETGGGERLSQVRISTELSVLTNILSTIV